MFDLYPRHGHRTPDQIAEDTGSSFEPQRLRRRADDFGGDQRQAENAGSSHGDDITTAPESGERASPR